MANHRDPAPEWLNTAYMQNTLRSALKSPDLSVTKLEITPGSSVGDNYICQIFRITVFLGENDEKMSVIGKLMPNTKKMDDVGDGMDVFDTEARFFSETLGRLENIEKIDKAFAPKPYYVDFERKIIFMEDLKAKGFYLQPRTQFLNRDQARLAIEAVATLHGISHRLIEEDPNFKTEYTKTIWCGTVFPLVHKLVGNGMSAIDQCVDSYGFSEEWTKKLREVKDKLEKDWFKVCDRKEGKLNFLIHGDCWKSNLMFHKTEESLDDIRLLDFQIIHYNSFANDLQLLMFSSVDADVIINDLDWLLERYFEKLRLVAPDVPDLSLERVKVEFSERYFFGIIMAVIYRAYNTAETPFDTDHVSDGNVVDDCFQNSYYIEDLRKLLGFFEKVGAF